MNTWYRRLDFFTTIFLPGSGSLYFGLIEFWGWSLNGYILGFILVAQALLKIILIMTGQLKYGGVINVFETPDKLTYSLELNDNPRMLKDMKEVTFRINPSE